MSAKNPFLTVDRQMVGDIFTGTEVMDNLTVLCDEFGSRFADTPGEKQAAEFLAQKMRDYGLQNVHSEPVDYLGWRRGTATLEIVAPIQKTIPCISLPLSPAASVEARLVDMGDGAPTDFDARAAEISGNVVLTSSVVAPKGSKRWIHRNEKYGRSMLAGASAFIFANHYPAYGPATGSVGYKGQAGKIPAISVSKEDGDFLRRAVKKYGDVTLRITTTDELFPATSWNVVGELPGSDHPDEIVMVGSHYDGHDIAQGAQDPASGTVSVLEAARVLAKYAHPLPRTVRFVFWGIEELGLQGSKAYAKAHADEFDRIRFYLNMDAAGAMENRGINLNMWDDLQPVFEAMSAEMAEPFNVGQSVSAHSDHYPFFMAGVPTGGIESIPRSLSGRGYGHTKFDTLDKVSLKNLRETSAMAARVLLRIAYAENWRAAKRSPESVQAALDTPEHREELAHAARMDEFYG